MLGSLGSALEGQVLEEVGSTVRLVRFRARTGINPHADGGGLRVGRVLCCNLLMKHHQSA